MSKSPDKFREFIWAMYDFADTIFSMNVVSLYFPLLIVSDLGAEDIYVGAANSASQIGVILLAPLLGTISDRTGKRMPLFTAFAIITAVATASMMFIGKAQLLWGALFLFFIANLAYQLSLTFYNSLLPRVSSAERWGKVSGLGTALGYVGSIVGMAMVMPFNTGKFFGIATPIPAMGRTGTFIPTAVLFSIFALPTLIYYFRDEKLKKYPADTSNIHPITKIIDTIRDAKKYRGIRTFLASRLLFQEGVETTIVFMGVFAEKAMNMPDSAKIVFFIIATTAAVVGSFIIGRITDALGAHRTLMLVLLGWIVGLSTLAMFPNRLVFWFVGGWLGIMLGGVWTASRPYLLHLAPPDAVGRFFGLYSLSGKAAAVLGPLVWGATTLALKKFGNLTAYRGAVISMTILITAGTIMLHKNRKVWK